MAYVWLFIPHVVRAIIGLLIVLVKGLPKSDDILSQVEIPSVKEATLESL
jgi:hypothetical protein